MRRLASACAALAFVFAATPAHARATCQTEPVVMFMTDWCNYCNKTIAFFRKHGVRFEPINVETSNDPRIAIQYKRGYGIPYILTQGGPVLGYNEPQLRKTLCIVD